MWGSLIAAVIPLVMKVVTYVLDKRMKDDEAKRKFLALVERMTTENPRVATRLSKASKDQMEILKEKYGKH